MGYIWPIKQVGTRKIYRRVGRPAERGYLPLYVVYDEAKEWKEQLIGDAKTLRSAERIAEKG